MIKINIIKKNIIFAYKKKLKFQKKISYNIL